MDTKLVEERNLPSRMRKQIETLQHTCFPDISWQEAKLDFCHVPTAHVLVFDQLELIGWAGLHVSKVSFEEQEITLGGYGICTHPAYRRKGVARHMCRQAFIFLRKHGCDVAFISVDPKNFASVTLHKKCGFVFLRQPFSWHNALGEIDSDDSGMIAPICSAERFAMISNSKTKLYVGKGYW